MKEKFRELIKQKELIHKTIREGKSLKELSEKHNINFVTPI